MIKYKKAQVGNLLVRCPPRAMLAGRKQGGKEDVWSSRYRKTMLEVSKELGVSKDVVKYHQRKMNSNETFKAGGKYISHLQERKKSKMVCEKIKSFTLSHLRAN